jgi:hypothetical protein
MIAAALLAAALYGQPPAAASVCTPGIALTGVTGFGEAHLTAHPCGPGREFRVEFDGILGPVRYDILGRESIVYKPGLRCRAVGWLGRRVGGPWTYHGGHCS